MSGEGIEPSSETPQAPALTIYAIRTKKAIKLNIYKYNVYLDFALNYWPFSFE